MLDSAAIGKKIKEFRVSVGLTQEGLAERLGITFQQVQRFEKGTTKVNLSRLQQLAEILEVPVSAFFAESPNTVYNLTNEELRLLEAFKQVPKHVRGSVLDVVENMAVKKP
ncbi:helix-turn-helix domain-containing protein [Geomonas sp. Red32]|uniref:helix-turn-helix domain-containing protein n=1 Tax=Geomonas sp. Red32 TaxID=2912856 RepID=UPI00202CB34D|nr:helix-turn-helix transcriptional regulator [Geomonas sp. Red32]MCM0082308.1 helix-turn-helix domain-containing protein [Geomonas sp. Red32]